MTKEIIVLKMPKTRVSQKCCMILLALTLSQGKSELIIIKPTHHQISRLDIPSNVDLTNGFAISLEISDPNKDEGCISYGTIDGVPLEDLLGDEKGKLYLDVLVKGRSVLEKVLTVNTGSYNEKFPICLDNSVENVTFLSINTTSKLTCDKNMRFSAVLYNCDTNENLLGIPSSLDSSIIVLISFVVFLLIVAAVIYIVKSKPTFWREVTKYGSNLNCQNHTGGDRENSSQDLEAKATCEKDICEGNKASGINQQTLSQNAEECHLLESNEDRIIKNNISTEQDDIEMVEEWHLLESHEDSIIQNNISTEQDDKSSPSNARKSSENVDNTNTSIFSSISDYFWGSNTSQTAVVLPSTNSDVSTQNDPIVKMKSQKKDHKRNAKPY